MNFNKTKFWVQPFEFTKKTIIVLCYKNMTGKIPGKLSTLKIVNVRHLVRIFYNESYCWNRAL